MKSLKTAHKTIKEILPNLKDISKSSNQGGEFLVFTGFRQIDFAIDELSFKILVQNRSYDDSNSGLFTRIDEIRDTLIKNSDLLGRDAVLGVDFEGFDGSLFIYSINLKFKVYRNKE